MTSHPHTDIRRTLLFLRREGQILLALKKRGFGEGLWNSVGGKIEPGETIEHAMIRECREEIGVRPMAWEPVAELDFVQHTETDEPWHMYGYVYTCEEWEGEIHETEEMKPEWFDVLKVPYDKMWEDDELWLPQVLGGKKVTGEFTFDHANKLLTHDVRIVEKLPHEHTQA